MTIGALCTRNVATAPRDMTAVAAAAASGTTGFESVPLPSSPDATKRGTPGARSGGATWAWRCHSDPPRAGAQEPPSREPR